MEGIMTEPATTAVSAPVYKYVSVEGLKRILAGSIRLTQPSAFNDPFELLPEVVMPTGTPEQPISIQFDIGAERRNPAEEIEHVPDGWQSSDPTSRQIVQQLNSLIGIFCMSRRNDSLLMWAHYANDYTGAVVEFDSTHEFFAGQIEVEYKPLRPKRHINAYTGATAPIPVAELCTKSTQWEYEHEVRIIRCLTDCQATGKNDPRGFPIYTKKLPDGCIKSIILGERTPVKEQREVYTRLKETNVALSLAAIDHAGYGFRYEVIKYNVPVSKSGLRMSPRTAHLFSDRNAPSGEFARWMIEKHPLSKVVNLPV
jgi:hypothetical protein